ncbi:hypothetical protein OIU78_015803, partial [Salix suchowensis]
MEEEEEKKEIGQSLDIREVDSVVKEDSVGESRQENVNVLSGGREEIENENPVSDGLDSVDIEDDDDDQFELVSLKEQEKGPGEFAVGNIDSNRRLDSESERFSFDRFGEVSSNSDNNYGPEFDSSPSTEIQHDRSVLSTGPERQSVYAIKQSHSSTSLDPGYFMDGFSPTGSPQKAKPKAAMPNVSPELLHLLDSAIMGKSEILDKLKNIVSGVESFGSGEEGIAYLVVDSLLATMGGVESFEDEDHNPPSVMLNSRAAIVAAELIPCLPWVGDNEILMSPRTRMVRGLLAILRACTRNRAMCSTAGLLGVLLGTAEKIFVQAGGLAEQMRWDGTTLCYCIQYLAGHSLNAMGGKESKGPASTFEFDGESSGLLGPGESRWPFTNGFAFATWIYIESFADTLNTATVAAAIAAAAAAKSGKSSAMSAAAAASALAGEGTAHMPRLFSFLSADNQGIEAYFHAQFLVVESGSGKGKKASLHFTHAFKPQCWYFIGLEHICKQGLIGKTESELRLYIDGSLYETRPFEFPRISKPLAFCCIGTNPPPTMAGLQRRRRQCPLFAEMGPVYIFKEPIGPERMTRLASRGGDVLPHFGNAAGLPWRATNDHVQAMAEESSLLDAEIGGCIHLLYHPSLLNGRFCPDASPSGAAG